MPRLWIFLACLVVSPTLFAVPVANLQSLEGEVSVLRAGVLIPSEKIAEGFALEPFDTLSTGATGKADVRFVAATGLSGRIHIDADASFYLDASALAIQPLVGVELLKGAVSIRLTPTEASPSVEIRTELGSFASPGPGFRVLSSSSGDVLVTVESGKVSCRVGDRTVFLEPGAVGEAQTLDGLFVTPAVNVSTLASYEATWAKTRAQVFRDQAAAEFRVLASRYQLQAGHVQRAWDRVQGQQNEDLQGSEAAIANLRRAAGPFERSIYRVKALRGLYESGLLSPSLELSRGYPAKDFFRQAVQDEALWLPRLGQARGLYRTVADRHGGSFPQASEGWAITYDSPFFQ
jgi:hypothetical protein